GKIFNRGGFGDVNEISARDGIAEELARLFETCRVDICQRKLRAAPGQVLRQSTPDPGSRSGYDCNCTTNFTHRRKDNNGSRNLKLKIYTLKLKVPARPLTAREKRPLNSQVGCEARLHTHERAGALGGARVQFCGHQGLRSEEH